MAQAAAATQSSECIFDVLDQMTEAELEAIIANEPAKANDARYILGRLLIEGSNPEIAKNDTKGINWVKTAAKNGHIISLEYKTYHDIRFARHPNVDKIMEAFDTVVEQRSGKNSRACNTIAEFAHAQASKDDANKDKAARYYAMSAEQGCLVGQHWMGVFYMEGFGVARNINKAEALLLQAAKMGNGQSNFQLFQLYSTVEEKKDLVKAYRQLTKAVNRGVTYFDQLHAFFKANFDKLKDVFCEIRAPPASVDRTDRSQLENLHEAMINDLQTNFMAALGRDRMYKRPCGAVTDQQIWMLGVLLKYFVDKVMHFDVVDFKRAISIDLGPLLGETGLWAFKNYLAQQTAKGNDEKKKVARNAIDIITKYLESGMEQLGIEKKYNMLNRFGPKKFPAKRIVRNSINILYSWMHYAPLVWFESQRQFQAAMDQTANNQDKPAYGLCSFCSSPEGETIKHKRCSACKTRLYCSIDCQRNDWRKGHKSECKALAAKGESK